MKNRIELTIEHKDHYTVELTNSKGDTFTYNPQKYEVLEDFLSRAEILPIADAVGQGGQLVCDCEEPLQFYKHDKHCTCCNKPLRKVN